jgi:hypothetical protein
VPAKFDQTHRFFQAKTLNALADALLGNKGFCTFGVNLRICGGLFVFHVTAPTLVFHIDGLMRFSPILLSQAKKFYFYENYFGIKDPGVSR